MGNRLADLLVALGLDSARYTDGLKKAQGDLLGFAGVAAQASKRIAHLLEFDLVLRGAERFASFVKSSAEAADHMGKMAQTFGVPVAELSRLAYAANLAEVSTEELGANLKLLAKHMAETAAGSGESAAAFRAIGVSVTDTQGHLRPMQDVLLDIAERFAGYKDGAGKAALAQELFGKSGAVLIPFLNEGRAGIERLSAEADRFGLTITDGAAKSADEFGDAIDRLGGLARGLGNSIAAQLTPMLANLGEQLATSTTNTGAMNEAASALAYTVKSLVSGVVVLGAGLETVGKSAAFGASSLVSLVRGDFSGAADVADAYMRDMANAGRAGAERLQAIWSDAAAKVEGGAEATSAKLAAPVVRAAEKMSAAAKEAAREAKRFVDESLSEWNARMKEGEQVAKSAMTPLESHDAELIQLRGLLDDAAIGWDTFARAVEKAGEELSKSTIDESIAAFTARMEEGARTAEALRTPLENYGAEVARLKGLLNDAAIGPEMYSRGAFDAQAKFQGAHGDLFAGTNEGADLQAERTRQIYAEIESWRQADLVSEETAQRMKARVALEQQALQLEGTRQFWGTLATMQNSSIHELAVIGKAAAIAQATIDGILAVQKALASAPPPFSFAMAAAVGAVTAANVAQIAGVGFEAGGFTGWGGRDDVAGVVHGQEFVANAAATSRYRPLLEAMNSGKSVSSGAGAVALGGVQITIENHGTLKTYESHQLSPSEIRLIARDEVQRQGPRMVEGEISDPNSRTSRALSSRTTATRRRT
jgi:predicted HicB family RNase H-like nuclease